MPNDTQTAVDWALQQTIVTELGEEIQISKDTPQHLVDKVREYFNANNIAYNTFSYSDLKPFLN